MKNIFITFILLLKISFSYSQDSIAGIWHSEDNTRIYNILPASSGYEAVLLESKRENEKPGTVILYNVTYKKEEKMYCGFIRAVGDGMTVRVKIRKGNDGKSLKLKLSRMVFFPVYISWVK